MPGKSAKANNRGASSLISNFVSGKARDFHTTANAFRLRIVPPITTVTGGTITTPGNGYKYHFFTSPGSLSIGGEGAGDYIIVAGGGSGGSYSSSGYVSGGRGSNTTFNSQTAIGGGCGVAYNKPSSANAPGGSGGAPMRPSRSSSPGCAR